MSLRRGRYWLFLLLILLFSCTEKAPPRTSPVDLVKTDVCSLCGMTILDYPGPKAEIIYRDGRVDKFCSVQEMMSLYLQPDKPRGIVAIYVTDMSEGGWRKPGKWIEAKDAIYVYDANISGAMGNELVPFSDRASAERFIQSYGGKIVSFDEVTLKMLEPKL